MTASGRPATAALAGAAGLAGAKRCFANSRLDSCTRIRSRAYRTSFSTASSVLVMWPSGRMLSWVNTIFPEVSIT